jgi:hypothetical protein
MWFSFSRIHFYAFSGSITRLNSIERIMTKLLERDVQKQLQLTD